MEWISVKNQLPKDCSLVLVAKAGFLKELPYICLYDDGEFKDIDNVYRVFTDVTY